jgi:c-di-GMP-binding flagellar brake protein YcgR
MNTNAQEKIQNEIEIPKEVKKPNSENNRRMCLRVEVDKIFCMMQFDDFGDSKLNNLKSKKIDGYIEDISLTGLKFVSNFELPVRSNINITVSFKLDGFVFAIPGKIVRRADHLNNDFVTYGIQFTSLLPNQQKQLNELINEKMKKTL